VIWNVQHGFPTVRHTGTNIGWKYPYFNPGRALEYLGIQLGVFGPILLAVLLRTAWRESRGPSASGKVLLLSFSMPVLALLLLQSLLSKAHGNWSATAYPAATILVTQVMLELGRNAHVPR
jgi:4-amino-4-deoxy-L-arabinose transferase-like glycosyltransferase